MKMEERHVVAAFLRYRESGRILLLKRSGVVPTYKFHWGPVAGDLDPGENPPDACYREIEEETGITGSKIRVLIPGREFPIKDDETGDNLIIHPYLLVSDTDDVRLNAENLKSRWSYPREFKEFKLMPRVIDVWISLQD